MRVACILFLQEVNLAEFAQACIRFSPQISIRPPYALFIEIGKCSKLYSEPSFLARLRVLLKRFHYSARITLADDIPTALALARYEVGNTRELPIDSLCEFGDPFGIDAEGLKSIRKMIEALKRLGLRKISDFVTLPTSQFPSRFGRIGLFCRQQLEEKNRLPWPYWQPPQEFTEKRDLLSSEFCSDIEPLLFYFKETLDRLFSRLRGSSLRADRIQISLELEKTSLIPDPTRIWNFEFISPQGSTSGFLPILRERLHWDLQNSPLASPVISVQASALATSISLNAQKNLFHSRDAQDKRNETLGSFFGQMEEFLGKGQVFWADITEERFPEKSWRRHRSPEINKVSLTDQYPMRPTRIFKSPIPITVICSESSVTRIVLKGRQYRAHKWSSVERLSLDWLNETPARNYYRVHVENGPTLWVYTDNSNGTGHHYFLHGYYE